MQKSGFGLMLIMADVMSYEMIIEEMEKQISSYKEKIILNASKKECMEVLKHLTMYTTMLSSKIMGEQTKEGAFGLIKEMEEIERLKDLHTPGKQ